MTSTDRQPAGHQPAKNQTAGNRPGSPGARQAAARAAQQAARRRTMRVRVGAGVAAALAVAGVVTLGALTGKDATPADHQPPAGTSAAGGGRAGPPPWTNAANPSAAITRAGLQAAGSEGSAEHYHAHLDVLVNGKPVAVAAGIGVDEQAHAISPLHTHDPGGVVHIEAPTVGDVFTLGQLFTEWDVALSAHQLGALRTGNGNTLTAYVNGKPVAIDPAAIRLAAHQQIALVYGPADQRVTVPATYDFGNL